VVNINGDVDRECGMRDRKLIRVEIVNTEKLSGSN
jgi:hypothetical protein